jgi:hypothetical protein
VLLAVTLLISVLTLGTGWTTVLQGAVHLVISVLHRGALTGGGAAPTELFGSGAIGVVDRDRQRLTAVFLPKWRNQKTHLAAAIPQA